MLRGSLSPGFQLVASGYFFHVSTAHTEVSPGTVSECVLGSLCPLFSTLENSVLIFRPANSDLPSNLSSALSSGRLVVTYLHTTIQ